MNHSVRFTRKAEHDMTQIARADQQLCKRITRKLEALQTTSFLGKPLVGNHEEERSLQVGAYRIVYEVWEGKRQVIILTVKHRRHVY